MERRMKYSEGDGKLLHELSVDIARLTNPHCHFNLKKEDKLIVASERGQAEKYMEELLEGGVFADFVNKKWKE
jgi:hypothetical protein